MRMIMVVLRGSRAPILGARPKRIAVSGNENASLAKNNFCKPCVPLFRISLPLLFRTDSNALLGCLFCDSCV